MVWWYDADGLKIIIGRIALNPQNKKGEEMAREKRNTVTSVVLS
jgi:hypothetical protein